MFVSHVLSLLGLVLMLMLTLDLSSGMTSKELDKWLSTMPDAKLEDLLSAFDDSITTTKSTTESATTFKMPSPNSHGCDTHRKQGKIIDVKESLNNGARMLMEKKSFGDLEQCESACCSTKSCDLAVFRAVPDKEGVRHCYLFNCEDHCQFSEDTNFLSSFITPKQEERLPITVTTKIADTTTPSVSIEDSLTNQAEQLTIDVCTLPLELGHCFGKFSMWYFDTEDQACKEFSYTGCRGNKNRFDSEKECSDRCGKEERKPVGGTSDKTSAKPYSPCKTDADCSYSGGACAHRYCLCVAGYFVDRDSCHKKCSTNEFSCLHAGVVEEKTVSCVPSKQRCDGNQQCVDGSDEMGCDDEEHLDNEKPKFVEEVPELEEVEEVEEVPTDAGNTSMALGATAGKGAAGALRANQSMGAVVALSLALGLTFVMLLFVGCRLRTVKGRLRKGRPKSGNEADYLINGMYL